ncbi:MAG: hypothetical protein ACREJO_12180 [Phycisphaerales bacterium]
MSAPAVKLRLFKAPAQATGPSVGADDFVAMVPLVEVLSAGDPPVAPTLVQRLTPGVWSRRVVRSSAGYTHTAALDRAGRSRWVVGWPTLTRGERDALVAFFRDEVVVGEGGGQFGFTIEPDGPGNGTLVVRPIGPVAHRWVAGNGGGAREVHAIEGVECEEVVQ